MRARDACGRRTGFDQTEEILESVLAGQPVAVGRARERVALDVEEEVAGGRLRKGGEATLDLDARDDFRDHLAGDAPVDLDARLLADALDGQGAGSSEGRRQRHRQSREAGHCQDAAFAEIPALSAGYAGD